MDPLYKGATQRNASPDEQFSHLNRAMSRLDIKNTDIIEASLHGLDPREYILSRYFGLSHAEIMDNMELMGRRYVRLRGRYDLSHSEALEGVKILADIGPLGRRSAEKNMYIYLLEKRDHAFAVAVHRLMWIMLEDVDRVSKDMIYRRLYEVVKAHTSKQLSLESIQESFWAYVQELNWSVPTKRLSRDQLDDLMQSHLVS